MPSVGSLRLRSGNNNLLKGPSSHSENIECHWILCLVCSKYSTLMSCFFALFGIILNATLSTEMNRLRASFVVSRNPRPRYVARELHMNHNNNAGEVNEATTSPTIGQRCTLHKRLRPPTLANFLFPLKLSVFEKCMRGYCG